MEHDFLEELGELHEIHNNARGAYYSLRDQIYAAYPNGDVPQELILQMNMINDLICDPREEANQQQNQEHYMIQENQNGGRRNKGRKGRRTLKPKRGGGSKRVVAIQKVLPASIAARANANSYSPIQAVRVNTGTRNVTIRKNNRGPASATLLPRIPMSRRASPFTMNSANSRPQSPIGFVGEGGKRSTRRRSKRNSRK